MIQPLSTARPGQPLVISAIAKPSLAAKLARLGLAVGAHVVRLDESVDLAPVKVRCAKGEAVLTGAMAAQVVAHLQDGRMLPLTGLQPRETGHVEGILADGPLAGVFRTLGFGDDEDLTLVRKLPPMLYITLVDDHRRVRMDTGQAALLWGCCKGDSPTQFAMAAAGQEFVVQEILGGSAQRFSGLDIQTGSRLKLERVEPSSHLDLTAGAEATPTLVLQSQEGLRLHLSGADAGAITVRPAHT